MNLEGIQQELAKCDDGQLRELIRYAVSLRDHRLESVADRCRRKLDDPNHEWLAIEEFDRRAGFRPGDAE